MYHHILRRPTIIYDNALRLVISTCKAERLLHVNLLFQFCIEGSTVWLAFMQGKKERAALLSHTRVLPKPEE